MKKKYISLIFLLVMLISAAVVFASVPPAALPVAQLQNNNYFTENIIKSKSSAIMSGTYIGNSRTKKFHYPDCKWAKLYVNEKPYEVVYFSTRQEAVDAGYIPCKGCKP